MRHRFFLLLFTLLSLTALAQRSGNRNSKLVISGQVLDENAQPIPYASVAAKSITDSTKLIGLATSLDGDFELEVTEGRYTVIVSFLSYQEYKEEVAVIDQSVRLGKIKLEPKTELIEEVVVSGEKSYMEMKLDRRVYNVGKDPNNAGSNAQEILETVPSVEVDVDGTVSLRGSSNVRILVDGKPSSLTGISSQDALRQLPGNLIEKIEVVTNASAKYDAEGEAGILNIVLKKEKRSGLNGSFEVNAGYPHNYGGSANVNYRTGKINFFTSIGAQYRRNPGSGNSFQEFFLEDTTFAYERKRRQDRGGVSGNGRFGLDYFINEKTTLTASGMYSRSYDDNKADLTYTDFDENDIITQVVNRNDAEIEQEQSFEVNLNFRREFKKKDQLLTADFRWFNDEDYEDAEQFEEGSDYVLNQRTDNTENQQNWLVQADYVHPFSENIKLETGTRITLRQINNDYQVEQLNDTTGDWQVLDAFNNNFIFNENIYAGYLMASGKFNRFSVQGGLRAEYSDIRTELERTNEVNNQRYISFFPSAHLSYEFANENSVQVSYSRRISRPRFRELIPFFSLTDNRNFFAGNPDVQPVFTHSAEIGHLKTWENGTLLSSVYYRHREGVVERIAQSDSTGFISTFPINLSSEDAVGLELNFSYSLFKWWRLTFNTNAYYSTTRGEFEGQDFSAETLTARTRFTNKWTIWKRLNVQTAVMYNAPRVTPQGRQLSMFWWDIGASIDVLSGNGTVTLSVKDLLNSRVRRWEVNTPELVSTNDFQWRERQVVVSFAYRLNQKKQRGSGREGGNMDDGF